MAWLRVTVALLLLGAVVLIYAGWVQRAVALHFATHNQAVFQFLASSDNALALNVTVDRLQPGNDQMDVHLEFFPGANWLDERGGLVQTLQVTARSVTGPTRFTFPRGTSVTPLAYTAPMRGSSFYYPNDRYHGLIQVEVRGEQEQPVPLQIRGYSQASGFVLSKDGLGERFPARVKEFEEGNASRCLVVVLGQRSPLVQTFATLILALEWMTTVAVLAVVGSVALLGRRAEPSLLAWLAATLFALPALRNMMVEAPAIGVYIDFFGFLCCEALVTLSLLVLALLWIARRQG